MTQPKPIISGHGRWECRHGFLLTQCRCIKNHGTPNIVPCLSVPNHETLMVDSGLAEPHINEKPAPPVEPCGDRNPWDQAGGPTHGPFPPCGRPKGHDDVGGQGGQWGKGHSERPSVSDPPVKEWRQTWSTF